MHATTIQFGIIIALLAGCATSETVCSEAAAHLEACGLSEPTASATICDAEAAALGEAVLELTCDELAASGKADGNGGHSAGDDFKCNFLGIQSACACTSWSDRYSARDFSGRSLTGHVLDADTLQPVVLEPGQWLEVKTANTGGSYDTQRVGSRLKPDGGFALGRLECDRTDLRVRINDAMTEPERENPSPEHGGRSPLVATIQGVELVPDGYPKATVFRLGKVKSAITVLVRPGVAR